MSILIQNFLIWIESSKYILLLIGAIPEGPILMMTSGFLYHLGTFSFWPMYIALVIGDFIADMTWYCIGRFGTRHAIYKYGNFLGITPESITKVENLFKKYHLKILIISKLTMGFGFGFVILMVAGMFKIEFKRYLSINLIGGFIWTFFLISIGYFFGNIFTLITGPMKIVFLFIIFISAVLFIKFGSEYLKNKNI